MAKRTLQELNLLDDFLLGSVTSYPEIGERVSRHILETIFQKKFGKLTVVPQKVYYGSDTNQHGARLDVYLEEDISSSETLKAATVYDLESDKNDDPKSIEALPKRIRFYHAKINAHSLKSGEHYSKLKNVIVIIIMPYDPFGMNHMVYTVCNHIKELPDFPYDDGAKTLFLYTKGELGSPSQELKDLLHYMEETTAENARNQTLMDIHQMVNIVKQDKEVSTNYMKAFEHDEMIFNRGVRQGHAEGHAKGLAKGRTEGHAQGLAEGRAKEQANTERERQRADAAEAETLKLKANTEREREKAAAEILELKAKIARLEKLSL